MVVYVHDRTQFISPPATLMREYYWGIKDKKELPTVFTKY